MSDPRDPRESRPREQLLIPGPASQPSLLARCKIPTKGDPAQGTVQCQWHWADSRVGIGTVLGVYMVGVQGGI